MTTTLVTIPKGDSYTILFSLQDSTGAAVAMDSTWTVALTVAAATPYQVAGVVQLDGTAVITVPKGALAAPGAFAASIVASTSTAQHTLAFTLRVTDHA